MARSTFEEINIGPFVGGLNTLSDQSSIADTELIEMVNFECDKDGSLVSRPPIFKASPDGNIHETAGSLRIIGYFVDAASGAYYLIGSNRMSRTAYYANGVWTTITDTFAATACVQFRDSLHLLAPLSSGNPGGTWTPSGGFIAVPTMPKGAAIVANKERLWVAQGKDAPTNGSRVYVSDISSGSLVWDGDFINVQQGDGQNIVDLAIVYSDLIVFKQRSTYRFSFDADIATGAVTRLSDNIGASDTGCFASLEDRLFVLFDNVVYDFTSYRFTRLNTTVPLKSDVASGALSEVRGISVWSDRLFVNYFGRTLVYNLITRVWCEWQSPNRVGSIGRLFPFPTQLGTSQQAYLYSVEPLGSEKGKMLYRTSDQFDSTGNDDYTTENYTCHFETKNYDYKSPSKFKRLALWGADILSRTNIDVQAKPVTYGRPVTWDTLKYGPGGPGADGFIVDKLKNMLQDPSFESGTTANWQAINAGTTLTISSIWGQMLGKVGNYIALCTSTGSTQHNGVVVPFAQRIPVTPGKWYLLRAWTAMDNIPDASMNIGAQAYDSAGSSTGLSGNLRQYAMGDTQFNWYNGAFADHIFQAEPTAASVGPRLYTRRNAGNQDPGKRVWVDQFIMAEFDTQAEAQAALAMLNARGYFDPSTGTVGVPVVDWGGTVLRFYPEFRPGGYSWDSVPGTWDRPVDLSYIISDNVSVEDISEGRKWVKFLKSLRFRQIAFRASADTDGSSRTAPIRVFSLTTYVKEKQLVPRKIN